MLNFGYNSLQIKSIDLDKANRSLASDIEAEEPSFVLCISCGSCSATCSSGNFNGFSFRKMCHSIKLGDTSQSYTESGKCMLCGKCTLVCPRNVNTRNIIRIVRRISKQ